jgi:streptomycin 6-kinase
MNGITAVEPLQQPDAKEPETEKEDIEITGDRIERKFLKAIEAAIDGGDPRKATDWAVAYRTSEEAWRTSNDNAVLET